MQNKMQCGVCYDGLVFVDTERMVVEECAVRARENMLDEEKTKAGER